MLCPLAVDEACRRYFSHLLCEDFDIILIEHFEETVTGLSQQVSSARLCDERHLPLVSCNLRQSSLELSRRGVPYLSYRAFASSRSWRTDRARSALVSHLTQRQRSPLWLPRPREFRSG